MMLMAGRVPESLAYARAPQGDENDVPLSEAYLKAVERVESDPRNENGADKTWVAKAIRDSKAHFAKAVRLR